MKTVRLNKIVKAYKVGIETLVDFFKARFDMSLDGNPNEKVPEWVLPEVEHAFGVTNDNLLEYLTNSYLLKNMVYCLVTGVKDDGLVVSVNGATALIPDKEIIYAKHSTKQEFVGDVLRVRVFNPSYPVTLSMDRLKEDETYLAAKEAVSNLLEGDIVSGEVTNKTEGGSFVNLGGVVGFVRAEEMIQGEYGPEMQGSSAYVVIERDLDNAVVYLSSKKLLGTKWDPSLQ